MRFQLVLVFIFFCPLKIFSEEPILEQLYLEGGRAWSAGETQVALNAWLKYREISVRTNEAGRSSRLREIENLAQQAKLKLIKEKVDPLVVLSPGFVRATEKRKSSPTKSRMKTVSAKRDPALLHRLMVQAQRASDSGRLEEARRFYRLALQVNPSNSNAENKLKDLEQMMEDN